MRRRVASSAVWACAATNTAFGLVPIYGHDVWLHGVLAVVAAYFGFVHKEGKAAAAAA